MSNDNLVPTLLDIMTPSTESGTDQEWELTLRFAEQHRDHDLAEVIFGNAPPDTEPWKVGSLIDHLIWNIPDESCERMVRTLESWIRGDDPRKVSYALAMEYVLPFTDPEEMIAVLGEVKGRWPEFGTRCDQLIARRSLHR